MAIWFEGPRVGPVRFGALLPEARQAPRRAAPPPSWGLRFAVLVAALIPVWTLGPAFGEAIGPSAAGVVWLIAVLFAAAVRAGLRLARYPAPGTATTLRWGATALGALCVAMLLTAFLAAALAT